MPAQLDPNTKRVNVLLPNPLLDGLTDDPLPPAPADGFWGKEEIAEARLALAELDRGNVTPPEVDMQLVERVIQSINKSGPMLAAMEAAGSRPAAEGPRYISLADLDGAPPPDGMPVLIPEIGVISTPAPPEGAGAALAAIEDINAELRVEESGIYRAATALASEHDEFETFEGAPAFYPYDGGSRVWKEAFMSVRAAAERMPWGVERVNAPAVWAGGFLGAGVRVAVVDTGVGPHIDLPQPVAGQTFVPGTNTWHDDEGHGTHVAGTVAALRNGTGVVGVAPRAALIAVKVLDSTGSGNWEWIAQGITWAVNQGADIINLSLAGGFSETVRRALAYARLKKVTICAAAGNAYGSPVSYPASDPISIAVGSIDRQNRRAAHSNIGPELDLVAPGVDILSTVRGNGYEEGWNGTSMATPHVAGVAALVLSRQRLDPTSLQQRLMGNALSLGAANEYGAGLVQADRAVLSPRPGT